MRRFLVGGAIVVTLIYWLGANGDEWAAINKTQLPSAGNVVQEEKAVVGEGTQVSAATSQQGKSSATVESPDTEEAIATVFVRGKRVALREGPGKKFPILDRYDAGRPVRLLSVNGEWWRVQDNLTRKQGWIASHLLSSEKPRSEPKRDTPASSRGNPIEVPRISDSVIVQRIIAESMSGYSGSVPMPGKSRSGRTALRAQERVLETEALLRSAIPPMSQG